MYARRIFEAVTSWSDVHAWVERQQEESLHLDFKQKKSPSQSDLEIEDRKNLAKALSGFANTEGGLLVFGIETEKTQGTPDHAAGIRAIANVRQFKTRLEDHIPRLVDSPVPVDIRIIESSDGYGVVLILIPQSDGGPHRSMGPADVKDRYYMRLSDRTEPMPHTFLAAMFGRRPPPQLYLAVILRLGPYLAAADLWIGNDGRGYADRPAVGIVQNPDPATPDKNPAFWWHMFEAAKGWDKIVLPAGGKDSIGSIIRGDISTILYPGVEMPLGYMKTTGYVPNPFVFSIHGHLYTANGQPRRFGLTTAPIPLSDTDLERHVERLTIPIL